MMLSHSRSYSGIGLKFAGTGEDRFAQAAVEVFVDGAAPCIKVILGGRDDNGSRPNSERERARLPAGQLVNGSTAVMGAEGATGAQQAEDKAGGGRSLKRKSGHAGKFWFSYPMVKPYPVFGLPVRSDSGLPGLAIRNLKSLPTPDP